MMEREESLTEIRKFGLTGSALKIVAVVSMFIDHIGAAFLLRIIRQFGQTDLNDVFSVFPFLADHAQLVMIYKVMRGIGRIAFPIYCFLLVEGAKKTRDIRKYAIRLGVFALISEIPFDLCFYGKIVELSYQNVFFTLLAGLCAVAGIQWAYSREWHTEEKKTYVLKMMAACGIAAAAMAAADLLRTDYGAVGVLCIIVLYLFSYHRMTGSVAGAVVFLWEIPAPLAFLLTYFYNGRRGIGLKYFFYLFYPVHLLLIYALCVIFKLT